MLRVLSLGAGVQSTTLLLMSELGELPLLDAAVFADTQSEPRVVYRHLEWLLGQVSRIPIYQVTAGNLGAAVLSALVPAALQGKAGRFGQPPFYVRGQKPGIGMLWRKCTQEYKIAPIERHLKRLAGLKPKARLPRQPVVEQWKGISVDELQRAACARVPWIVNRYPLIELRMRRHDCLRWMKDHGFPEPPKSACLWCPYRSDAEWRLMRDQHPDDFAEALTFDEALRAQDQHIPGTHGLAYVHRSAIPLRLVNFDTPEDAGQQNLFAREECAGVCGT